MLMKVIYLFFSIFCLLRSALDKASEAKLCYLLTYIPALKYI